MKQLIYIICCLSLSFGVYAQENPTDNNGKKAKKVKGAAKADRFYKNLGYAQYIEIMSDRDIADYDESILTKLGTSYRKTGDFTNAEKVYKKLLETQGDDPSNHLYYAQALQANGHYGLARKHFNIANENMAEEENQGKSLVAKNGIEACDQIPSFKAKGKVIVKNERALNTADLDFSPAYYQDGLVFVSTRGKSSLERTDYWLNENCMDLYHSNKKEGKFEKPKAFSDALNTVLHEGPVAFTDDQEKVFFTRNNLLNGKRGNSDDRITKLKIYSARQVKGIWKDVKELAFNDKNKDICHPTLSTDQRMMVFASSNGEGHQGGMDLYASFWQGDHWSTPVNLGPEINTAGNEVFPYIHYDGQLYFASTGHKGLGGLDIYAASRIPNDPDAFWEAPVNIGAPFNSKKDDFGFIMDMEKKTGYFTSNRPGGKGKDDIYSFLIKDGFDKVKPAPVYPMQLCVFDKQTSKRIEGAEVIVSPLSDDINTEEKYFKSLDGTTMVMSLTPVSEGSDEYRVRINDLSKAGLQGKNLNSSIFTNAEGIAPTKMEAGKNYRIVAKKDGYVLGTEVFKMPVKGGLVEEYCVGLIKLSTLLASGGQPSGDPSSPYYDPRLDKGSPLYDPNYDPKGEDNPIAYADPGTSFPPGTPHVKGIVLHEEYGRPIPNSEVTLLNRCTGDEVTVKVDKTGLFAFPLDCECEYVVKARKSNFIGDNQIISLIDKEKCEEPIAMEMLLAPGFDKMGNPLKIGDRQLIESIKEGDLIELKNIYYDFDQYYIRQEAAGDLDDLAILMRTFPSMEIELSSHTDSRASFEYNETLSSNRAKSAKEYLVKKGIAANRIIAKGYGELRPKNNCKDGVKCSEYEHQRNRRTEVFVTKFDKKDYIQLKYNDNEPTVVDPKRN